MTLETAIVRTRVRRQGPGGLPARETGGRVLVAAVAASPSIPGHHRAAKKLTDAIPGAQVGRRSR